MLYIECIDKTNCNTLEVGKLYYGFPTGGKALYVSRFPREGSHMGAYQRSRFNILTEEDFIAKKEALEVKPVASVSEKLDEEVSLENESNIEAIVEEKQVIEEASVEVVEALDVEKKIFESVTTVKVYRYQYVSLHRNRAYEVYGFINSLGDAVLYKDEALTTLIGVTSRKNIVVISELGKEINLKEYPVFMKAIKYGDLEAVPFTEKSQKVEAVQESVAEEADLADEKTFSPEVPLLEGKQEQIIKADLQEDMAEESSKVFDDDQYEQLSIFDF